MSKRPPRRMYPADDLVGDPSGIAGGPEDHVVTLGGQALSDRDEVLLGASGLRVRHVAPVEQEDAQGHGSHLDQLLGSVAVGHSGHPAGDG